jgi:hypothetical protein
LYHHQFHLLARMMFVATIGVVNGDWVARTRGLLLIILDNKRHLRGEANHDWYPKSPDAMIRA